MPAGCDPLTCGFPEEGVTFEQIWDCRLSGLPDLNHRNPVVRREFENWLQWVLGKLR